MSYSDSIRAITAAHANYLALCDLAETDEKIGEALATLHKAKAAHLAQFRCLHYTNGQWI